MADVRVLLTRPQPCAALMQALKQAGITAYQVPMIQLERLAQAQACLAQQLTGLPDGSVVIAISRPAVSSACQALAEAGLSWPPRLCYIAVGKGTAVAWQPGNPHPIATPGQADSEGLLAMVELSAEWVNQRSVLLLRGEGGRELLPDTLRRRGAELTLAELYRRRCPDLDGAALLRQWQQQNIGVIVATSGAILHNLLSLVPQTEYGWLLSRHLVVISERLERLAHSLGFQRTTLAAGADDISLLACLRQLAR